MTSFSTFGESARFLNGFPLSSAAGKLPRDGDPVAADSGLEHGGSAVQPGSVPRGREVVWPRHVLHPPPDIAAGELPDAGTGPRGETRLMPNWAFKETFCERFVRVPTDVRSLQ